MINQLLNQALTALMAGDKAKARQILGTVLKDDIDNEIAWLALSQVVEEPEKVIQCLNRVLQINPENEQARQRLDRLVATAMDDVSRVIQEIGDIQGQIGRDEVDLRKYKATRMKLGCSLVAGAVAIPLGPALMWAIGSELWFVCGGALVLAGMSMFFYAIANQGKSKQQVEMTQERIIKNKQKLATKQAWISAGRQRDGNFQE